MDGLQLNESMPPRMPAQTPPQQMPPHHMRQSDQLSYGALLSSWAESTGMHGLPNISRSQSPLRRTLWILLLLTGCSIMIWQIVGVVSKYYSYPINVQKGTEIQLPRPFPAVTLCNKCPAKRSKMIESFSSSSTSSSTGNSSASNATGSGVATVRPTASGNASSFAAAATTTPRHTSPPPSGKRRKRDSPPSPPTPPPPPPQPDASKYSWITGSVVSNGTRNLSALGPDVIPDSVGITYAFLDYYNSLTGGWKGNVGYQIGEFLIECSIGSRYCSQTDFTRFLHPLYGNCYTFNAARNNTQPFTVQQTGPLHGLTLTLFIDQSEYVGAIANSAGVTVVVHETNKQAFPEETGISVSPGQETYIGITQFYNSRLPSPYPDDCQVNYKDANALNNMYSRQSNYSLPTVNYSQTACMKTCMQVQVEKVCNCSSPNIPISDPTVDPLVNSSYRMCLYEYNSTTSTISENAKCMIRIERDAFKQCRDTCKQDCDEHVYTTSLAVSMWPSESYHKDSQRQIESYNDGVRRAINSQPLPERRTFMSKNFVKLIIFYNDPVMYSSISGPAYQMVDVLSDMGGQVGLWLGLSVLTLFEIMEMFVDLFALFLHRSLLRRRPKTEASPPGNAGQKPLSHGAGSSGHDFGQQQVAVWHAQSAEVKVVQVESVE